MAGLYIHIPFCKQRCYYCDFHFTTSLRNKELMIVSIIKEITARKSELNQEIKSVYFGGGTPSVLSPLELNRILNAIKQNYRLTEFPEITIEVNPDDITESKALGYKEIGINRISIGIQSFDDKDLKYMNRAHDAIQAIDSLKILTKVGLNNISGDLIYGIPQQSNARWLENIRAMISSGVNHISAYALTVEEKTPLYKLIRTGKYPKVLGEKAFEQYKILIDELERNEFLHYEISNFAKDGYISRHNSSYWFNEKYLGFGPSAHSYDGKTRRWNVSNNKKYLENIDSSSYFEFEELSTDDRYNEYIMTRLRTIWGIDLDYIKSHFGDDYLVHLKENSLEHIKNGNLAIEGSKMSIAEKAKFISDGISSDLFKI